MFENPGSKLIFWSKVLFWVGLALSAITSLPLLFSTDFFIGIIVLIVSILVDYIAALILCTIGDIAENTESPHNVSSYSRPYGTPPHRATKPTENPEE